MPAIAVGAVSMWSGYGAYAAATAWSLEAVAAGAMMVGGALSAYGGLTGDKKLAQTGMLIAGVGSLGVATLGAPAAAAPPVESATGAAGTATSAEAQALDAAYTGGATAQTGASSVKGMSQIDLMNAYAEKSNALMQATAKQNMLGSTIGGLAQGYGAWEQSQTQEDIADRDRAEREAAAEKRRANINNLTGITLPTVNMPRLPTTPGLIGATNAPTATKQPTALKPTVTMPGLLPR